QLPILHSRASEWYEGNGLVDGAIDHALQAEDFKRASHLIEGQIDAIWMRGEHDKLRRWLVGLPAELVLSKPQLCIFYALYMFTIGQQDLAERGIKAVEQALKPDSGCDPESTPSDLVDRLSDADRMSLRGRLAAIQAFSVTYSQGDATRIIYHARQALEYLPRQDPTMRSIVAVALGDAYAFKGDMAASYQAYSDALETSRLAGNIYFLIVANLKLANTLREQGKLQRTIEICQQQMKLANKSGLSQAGAVGWLLAIWGEALAELNDLDGAIDLVKKGVETTQSSGNVAMLGWNYLCLIRVLYSRGDTAGVEEIIQKIQNFGREQNVPGWVLNQIAVWQTRLWLDQNQVEPASHWAGDRGLIVAEVHKLHHEPDYIRLNEYIMLARILIAQKHLDETFTLLQWLHGAAETGERTTKVIEILLLHALAYQASGDKTQAMSQLEKALTLAEPGGFIRIFVDEGPAMAGLLYEILSHAESLRGISPDYVRRILGAFPDAEPQQSDPPKSQAPDFEYIEPLSERETEVLHLIAAGLTNPEIAARLYLSLNTIKVHTHNIYGKLGVKNRTHAVATARALGILPSN
ncbi:LuxR C-terminal-related transcriptional regulator, partial [Chloroflexota bacterium]